MRGATFPSQVSPQNESIDLHAFPNAVILGNSFQTTQANFPEDAFLSLPTSSQDGDLSMLLLQKAAKSLARLAYMARISHKLPFPKVLASWNTSSVLGLRRRKRLDYQKDITLGNGHMLTSYTQLRHGLRLLGLTRLGLMSPRHQRREPTEEAVPRDVRPLVALRPQAPYRLTCPLPSVGSGHSDEGSRAVKLSSWGHVRVRVRIS